MPHGINGDFLRFQIMRAGGEIICKWKWLNLQRVEEISLGDCKPLPPAHRKVRDERGTTSFDFAGSLLRLTGPPAHPRGWATGFKKV